MEMPPSSCAERLGDGVSLGAHLEIHSGADCRPSRVAGLVGGWSDRGDRGTVDVPVRQLFAVMIKSPRPQRGAQRSLAAIHDDALVGCEEFGALAGNFVHRGGYPDIRFVNLCHYTPAHHTYHAAPHTTQHTTHNTQQQTTLLLRRMT